MSDKAPSVERSADGALRRLSCRVLRHERLLWALLALLCAASLALLPRMQLAFGFRGVMRAGHPDRVKLEAHEREFRLGDSLFIYFTGEKVYQPEVLRAIRDLSGKLERTEGVFRVFSAVDLLVPAVRDDHLRLLPILDADVLASKARTREVLSGPPFTDRWIGFLYDRERTVYTLIVRPDGEHDDPRRTVGLLERIEAELEAFRARTGVSYHLNGLFYLTAEMVRSTFRDQGWLTTIGITLLAGCFRALFGSWRLAWGVMLVLGTSILIAFGAMVGLGVPCNGLSGNLPVLTLVNGLEDVVHLLVLFFGARLRAGRKRSAAIAFRDCLVPNFLTSLTTFGALIVTGATDMVLLQAFGWAICIGVVVEWAVAIVFLPLLLTHLPDVDRDVLYYRLERAVSRRWLAVWWRTVASRWNLVFWGGLAAALVVYSSGQRLNANWYRYFVSEHPVTQTLGFLRAKSFPVTSIDCTIPSELRQDDLPRRPDVERDLRAIAAAIAKLPGVVRVDSWADLKGFIDARLDRVQFATGLAPVWKAARRDALYRQYVELGAFDEYCSTSTGRLRLVVSTMTEDARGVLELSRQIVAVVRPVKTETLDPRRLEVSGTMAYWGALMGYLAETFFSNVAVSMLFVFAVFVWVTRSFTISVLAMIPNVLPLFVMFSMARSLGYELNESFCVLDSLAIGNSVNDTLHYLFHVRAHTLRGAPLPEALRAAFDEVGCAMVISSSLVAVGFMACLAAEGVPVILSGVYMGGACVMAIAFDVFLHPAMLLRLGRWRR